jgi:hypothetical protein
MAKKRVFLDECCSEDDLKTCFPGKAHVYVAADFGVRGEEDPTVIDAAIMRGCLVIDIGEPLCQGLEFIHAHGVVSLI